MCIAQPSILSLCVFRNHDYDSKRGNDPSPTLGGSRTRLPIPAGRGNRAGGEVGALRACPKNVEGRSIIVHFLLPSGRRIGPRYQRATKSRLTQKYSIRNIAKRENVEISYI